MLNSYVWHHGKGLGLQWLKRMSLLSLLWRVVAHSTLAGGLFEPVVSVESRVGGVFLSFSLAFLLVSSHQQTTESGLEALCYCDRRLLRAIW